MTRPDAHDGTVDRATATGSTQPTERSAAPDVGSTDAGEPSAAASAEHRLWGGRFEESPSPGFERLNRSLPVDRRLWREDIAASRAWIRALAGAGVLTDAEVGRLDEGLARVADRLAGGEAEEAPDEDIHTLVERLLYQEVGEAAGKLHTGRSRNDQVATDTRLWAMRACRRIATELRSLQESLMVQAGSKVDLFIPGYTHLRRAQPMRVAHWLLAHFWGLERDRRRLHDALDRIAVLPLGSGAISGSGFPVDRTLLGELLGFRSVSPNSLDAVGDRDWVCELVFVASLIGTHLSRLADDLILYSSEEFGFIRLPEAFTTGSSLMPQKRNPDGLELARGKAARLAGSVTAALGLLKGLGTGYHKDLQEDKALLFDAVDTLLAVLPVTRDTVAGIEFDRRALHEAAADEMLLATDLADELVRRGVPFRDAHAAVGRLVREAELADCALADLPESVLASAHPELADGPRPNLSTEDSVEARSSIGGTSRTAVLDQLAAARAALRA